MPVSKSFHLVFLKYFLLKNCDLSLPVKPHSSTIEYNVIQQPMFLMEIFSTEKWCHSPSLFSFHQLQLSFTVSCFFGQNLWLKCAGGGGVGEEPEYLEANHQLDCQHLLSLQEKRKSVNAACRIFNQYIYHTKDILPISMLIHKFLSYKLGRPSLKVLWGPACQIQRKNVKS